MAVTDFTFQKVLLTGCNFGQPIQITGSKSGSVHSNIIHTAIAGTTNMDEIWLYANNTHNANIVLTLSWGASGSVDSGGDGAKGQLVTDLSASAGLYLVAPGLLLNNGQVLRGFASTVDKVNIVGYVNRISSSAQ